MARVAFVGLGKMGSAMAERLLHAGHYVKVFNRSSPKSQALSRRGAIASATPRDAATDVDAVFAMTADDESSRSVWLAADGILAANLAPATFAIECSTLSHGWVTELAAVASGRKLRYIDAPVTGLPDDAASGKLTLLVGADPAHMEAARPLLAAISDRILHFGPAGSGTVYKLIVNMIGAVQIASAAEGMAIAERAGLNLAVVADAIATGQAASPQVVRNTRRMAADDHDRHVVFTPALRLKDVEYALLLASKLDIGSPFGQLARKLLRELCDLDADTNESKIIEIARLQKI